MSKILLQGLKRLMVPDFCSQIDLLNNQVFIKYQYSITVSVRSEKHRNFRQIFQFKNIVVRDLLENLDK